MTEAGFMELDSVTELPPEVATKVLASMQGYTERITKKGCTCGAPIPNQVEDLHAYLHSGGWTIDGLEGRWWLYMECPECNYQWALWKLGVPR